MRITIVPPACGCRRAPIAALALVVAWGSQASSAQAADDWTDPFPGVRHLHRTTSGPDRSLHVLQVNLCHPGVSARVTDYSERNRTVASWAPAVGAQVAINGGENLGGPVMHAGVMWTGTGPMDGAGVLAFGHRDRRGILSDWVAMHHEDDMAGGPADLAWWQEAIAGNIPLVWDGARNVGSAGTCADQRARTAYGLSLDRRTLFLVTLDEAGGSSGATCEGFADLLLDLNTVLEPDIHWAMNMDGGGSTSMWISGAGVVNSSSDPGRAVWNHLGIHATGSGDPAFCHCDPAVPPDEVCNGNDDDCDGVIDEDDVCSQADAGGGGGVDGGSGVGDGGGGDAVDAGGAGGDDGGVDGGCGCRAGAHRGRLASGVMALAVLALGCACWRRARRGPGRGNQGGDLDDEDRQRLHEALRRSDAGLGRG